jgi:acetyl-CoA carboxylase biotin carboxyl carrier protein
MADDTLTRQLHPLYWSAMELARTAGAELRRLRIQEGERTVEMEWARDAGAPPIQRAAAEPAEPAVQSAVRHVSAPMVGTFYRQSEPGAKPFVEVGDLVTRGQQVGVLEAMKLMNAIEADQEGQVVEILVPNAAAVEYGQPLLAILPLDAD